jgi:rubrerythrin
MKPIESTPAAVLLEAIASEAESRLWLEKLADRAADAGVRRHLLELAERELAHRHVLEMRYREVTGESPPAPSTPSVDLPVDLRDVDLPRAFKLLLDRERDSESNFRFLAERTSDTALRNLFLELAEIEWKHKIEIQQMYDSVAGDPERFFSDM